MANAKTKVAFQRSATNARKMSHNFDKRLSRVSWKLRWRSPA